MQKLERTTFETSRTAEYFDARELQAMTGQPVTNFASVALKELVDNALDACETAGVEPKIGIRVHEEPEKNAIRITVSDNGPGIPPKIVEKVLDYDVRVSDKAAYRSPTRGAQGNALKTVIGIPYALGRKESLNIVGHGVRHKIRPWVDPAGTLRIEHAQSPVEASGIYKSGVSLITTWNDQEFEPRYWAQAFAMFNPHAQVEFEHAQPDDETSEIYKPGAPEGWRKYVPTDLTSPHWYTDASMKKLIFSHIAHAENNGGRDLPIGEFIRQFRGLSSPSKAKEVRAALNGIEHLSGFVDKPEWVGALLSAMQMRSKAPNHRIFGRVGEERFRDVFGRAYDVREFEYKWAKDHTAGGLPYVFEIAVAVTDEPGDLYYGINHTAAFDDPLEGTLLTGPKFKSHGIRGFLQHGHALPKGRGYYSFRSPTNVAVAVHIITPAPVFLDRGKTRIQLEEKNG